MKFNDLGQFFKQKRALEIGGPSALLKSFYSLLADYTVFNYEPAMSKHSQEGDYNIVTGDATNPNIIKQLDTKFDLLITSHTLEHIANPIKALKIWKQLLTPGGVIMNIVPCKYHCWDRDRNYTTLNHIISDYNNDTPESDMTHVDESSCMVETRPSYYSDVGACNEARIIHHHVYSKSVLSEMHFFSGFTEVFVDNIEDDKLQLTYIGRNNE